MAINVYFDDVQVGDELPAFSRQTDLANWNRFAAVNDEFIPMHMDDDAGRASGQAGAIGMGNLRWSYLLNALRDYFGDEADVRELGVQFRGVNNRGDVLSTFAVVVEKKQEDGENLVVLDVDVRNQNGEKTTPGSATVALPLRV
jgi:acyl dehydratase